MRPLVLAYHGVARAAFAGMVASMVVTADALAADIARLRASGRPFRLTFDDGWGGALTVAAPLLRELGQGAAFFVCPGLFGNADVNGFSAAGRMLTHEEAGELADLGFELGAHSMTHPDLTTLPDDDLAAELHDSKAAIEAITGRPCGELAYPFGRHDARVRAAAQAAGFELAFQYAPGPWRRFAAPRTPRP